MTYADVISRSRGHPVPVGCTRRTRTLAPRVGSYSAWATYENANAGVKPNAARFLQKMVHGTIFFRRRFKNLAPKALGVKPATTYLPKGFGQYVVAGFTPSFVSVR